MITIRVSNSLNPDKVQHFVVPDLGLNVCKCFQQMILSGKEKNQPVQHKTKNMTRASTKASDWSVHNLSPRVI